ncbi:hypothetical protein F7725_014055 [Dissostichus mawsoni]|uniref:Uncharacterized protein n=1 Tax=Dissostichus mawsoni TaxID=36200 RepID=A0A7J5YY04_DISMA|nr:hypothetical protein F7725_014055 [Dissostichus mawsoni]
MASRLGEGSLTKMSPLQVMDQAACLEGGPWIPLESQQETLNNASFSRARQQYNTMTTALPDIGNNKERRSQSVDGKRVLGVVQHGDQDGDIVDEGVQPPPLTQAHRGRSSAPYGSSMARVYVATDDRLQVSRESNTTPIHVTPLGVLRGNSYTCTGVFEIFLNSEGFLLQNSRGVSSLEVFGGSRSETSSEMKLSLVTLGMRGVSTGWSVGHQRGTRERRRLCGHVDFIYLVVESDVDHDHFSHHVDPARATGVVGVNAASEPHLATQESGEIFS